MVRDNFRTPEDWLEEACKNVLQ